MGAVYRAEQISLKRQVALKLLKPELSADPGIVRRFNTEAELAAKLNHPNTVTLYDFGQDTDGTLFIAMEYIEGRSLRDAIMAEAPLDAGRALRIIEQVCDSLANAHSHGIVHRDLKPDNVMLSERGREKEVVSVLDFGIAKLRDERGDGTQMPVTQAGDMLGTPQYMSPEQIRGEGVDGRTDIYAVGAMLYEMITGRLPFEGPTLMAILSKHLTDPPQPPAQRRPDLAIPPALDSAVMQSLNKSPAQRPQSMLVFGEQITAIRQGLGIATPTSGSHLGTGPGMPGGTGAAPGAPIAHQMGTPAPHVYGAPPLSSQPASPMRPPGVPLTSPPGAHHATPAPQAAPMGTPAPFTPASNMPPGYAPTQPGPTPHPHFAPPLPRRQPSSGRWLWIGLGVVAAAAIGVGIVFAVRGGSSDDKTSKSEKSDPVASKTTGKTSGTDKKNADSKTPDKPDVTNPDSYDIDFGRGHKHPRSPGNTTTNLDGTVWRHPQFGFTILVPDGFIEEPSADPEAVVFNGSRDGQTINLTVYSGEVDPRQLTDNSLMEVADSIAESLDGRVIQRKFRTVQAQRRLAGTVDAPQHGWRYEFVIFVHGNFAIVARVGSPVGYFDQLEGFREELFEARIALPSAGGGM